MTDYHPDTIKFDPAASLKIDLAQVALEEAVERGDTLRAEYAREWLRKLEAGVFGGKHEID